MNLTNGEKLQLKKLLEFILDEIWVDELDLKAFHPIVGMEKKEVKEGLKINSLETWSIVNLLGAATDYPFNKEYEDKCERIKNSCEFFSEKILELRKEGYEVLDLI